MEETMTDIRIGFQGKYYAFRVASNQEGAKYQLVESANSKKATPVLEVYSEYSFAQLDITEKKKIISGVAEFFEEEIKKLSR